MSYVLNFTFFIWYVMFAVAVAFVPQSRLWARCSNDGLSSRHSMMQQESDTIMQRKDSRPSNYRSQNLPRRLQDFQQLLAEEEVVGILVLPKKAFSIHELSQIATECFEHCRYESFGQEELDLALSYTPAFMCLPLTYEDNFVVILKKDPKNDRDDEAEALPKFYKYLRKMQGTFDALERARKLDSRKDIEDVLYVSLGGQPSLLRTPIRPNKDI